MIITNRPCGRYHAILRSELPAFDAYLQGFEVFTLPRKDPIEQAWPQKPLLVNWGSY